MISSTRIHCENQTEMLSDMNDLKSREHSSRILNKELTQTKAVASRHNSVGRTKYMKTESVLKMTAIP